MILKCLKIKRLLAIKPNSISLIDHKTKLSVTSQRMTDLKSWYSGDGYYNLTPIFMLNDTSLPLVSNSAGGTSGGPASSSAFYNGQSTSNNLFSFIFRSINSNSIDVNKLFVIEFRTCKWHLQIDDFHSLKSITCILLDQSLDMGIDSNPLMLDLTISEHFQNRYKLFSPDYQSMRDRNSVRNHHYQTGKKRTNTQSSSRCLNNMDKRSAVSNNSNSNSKSICDPKSPNAGPIMQSPSVSIMVSQRNHSMMTGLGTAGATPGANGDPETNSDLLNNSVNPVYGSFSVMGRDKSFNRSNGQMTSIFSANGLGFGYGSNRNGFGSPGAAFYSSGARSSGNCLKYEAEFQELQLILLWFPEEVAIRLTEVEYELIRQVPPIEYLRHATLDMNNFKSSLVSEAAAARQNKSNANNTSVSFEQSDTRSMPNKSVQDLIVRYKEVNLYPYFLSIFYFDQCFYKNSFDLHLKIFRILKLISRLNTINKNTYNYL